MEPVKQTALPDTAEIHVRSPPPGRVEEAQATGCGRRQTVWQWLVVFGIVLSLVNIFILYILHFEHNPFSSSDRKVSVSNGELFTATSGNAVPQKNYGLSYNNKGQIVSGAGTCVYLKSGSYPTSKILKYPYSAPINPTTRTDTILLSYYNQDEQKSELTTATVSDTNGLTIKPSTNTVTGKQIRGLTTLSPTLAVVTLYVGSNPSVGSFAPVTINSDKSITLHADKAAAAATGSAYYWIGRLSDTQFVCAYYDYYTTVPQLQNIIVGSVGSDNSVSLSTALSFGIESSYTAGLNTVFSTPTGVTVNGSPGFVVPWFTVASPTATNTTGTGVLCVLVGNADNGVPNKLYETCSTKYKPAYRADGTVALSSTRIAIAFYDQNSNYGVTVVVADVTPTAIMFGGDAVIPGTDRGPFNFGLGYAWSPSPVLTVLDDNKLAVAFHDSSQDGKPSTAVFSVSPSNRLTLVSPVVPYTTTFAGMSTTVASESYGTVLSVAAFNNGRYLASFLGPKGTNIQTQASVVTSSNPAVGIASKKKGNKMTMVLTGTYNGLSDLVTGNTYYVTGTGAIRGTDASKNQIGSNAVLIDNELIVSADARIGIATDDQTILLLPGVNN